MKYHPQPIFCCDPIWGCYRLVSEPRIPQSPTQRYPVHLKAPPSPDYVHGLEEPEQAPPLPEFVPKPVYLEFMPPEDDVLPAKERPLPAAVSPTADSPGYIADSDPKEDPEEDPTNYPADEGDDDDDDESSNDDEDDDDDVEEDEYGEEEEEHPAPADPVPPPVHRVTARMSIREQPPTPFWSKADIARLLAIPSPPPSPLSPWSSPLPQISSPLLPISSPVPVSPPQLPASPRYEVGESSSAPTARPTGGFRADCGFVATLDDEIMRDQREMLAPPSPDYVSGPKYPPLPEFVPEPVYPDFMPPEDDVLPAEEQPLPAAVLPTTDSPGYVPESDLEEDPEEEDDEDPEEDPANYLTDRDDEDEEEEPSRDDADDEEDDEDDEEEEHPGSADSIPPPIYCVRARISIRAQTPVSLPSNTEVARLLTIPTLPPSPLSLWSSPLPQILSLPLPSILSPPLLVSSPPLPASPTYPLGYRAAMIWLRAETPSTSHPLPSSTPPSRTPPHLPIPLTTPSPPLLLPSTDCRAGVFEVTLPPQKRLCSALSLRYEVGECSSAPTTRPTGGFRADYGFGTPAETDVAGLSERMTNFVTTVKQDTDEIYVRLDDVQDDRLLMSCLLNMLHRHRRAHARTALLMERKARLSREAWVRSMDASDTAHSEELALLCVRMFPEESDKIERYVSGLPDMIHESVVASRPKTIKKMITNNKTRGRTLSGPTLQDLVRRNLTEDLNLCVLNATITTMVHVLPSATSATELAI
ncbi:hypothetical protein Tco_0222437 [Tanacetum coccineum]